MRIKLDENLPKSLCAHLQGLGHDVHSAEQEGLSGKPDTLVWEASQRERRFFVTQDLDFGDIRKFAPGTHHGILLIRLGAPSPAQLRTRVGELLGNEAASEWEACVVVVTEFKVRVRKPAGA